MRQEFSETKGGRVRRRTRCGGHRRCEPVPRTAPQAKPAAPASPECSSPGHPGSARHTNGNQRCLDGRRTAAAGSGRTHLSGSLRPPVQGRQAPYPHAIPEQPGDLVRATHCAAAPVSVPTRATAQAAVPSSRAASTADHGQGPAYSGATRARASSQGLVQALTRSAKVLRNFAILGPATATQ